ncbi:MAG: GNAT family N-acetyltransferase [Clostridium sp.]
MRIVVIKEFTNNDEKIEQIKEHIRRKDLLSKTELNIAEKDYIFIVEEHDLEDSKDIIGSMVLENIDKSCFKIKAINLLEERRNLGLGTAMLKYALQIAKKDGKDTLIVENKTNLSEFYKKLGFVKNEENLKLTI